MCVNNCFGFTNFWCFLYLCWFFKSKKTTKALYENEVNIDKESVKDFNSCDVSLCPAILYNFTSWSSTEGTERQTSEGIGLPNKPVIFTCQGLLPGRGFSFVWYKKKLWLVSSFVLELEDYFNVTYFGINFSCLVNSTQTS